MKAKLIAFNLVILLGAMTAILLSQGGPLTPPGPPGVTMKTLDEVEPRIPINDTTAPGNPGFHHIITVPGSYYLPDNLRVTKENGILVATHGVTIDMMGFSIARVGGGAGAGIEIAENGHRCTVRNGSFWGDFEYGIWCRELPSSPRGGSFLQLSVTGCTVAGLLAGEGWEIDGCEAHDNPGNGIESVAGCTLRNCTATDNDGDWGIFARRNSTLLGCTASGNTGLAAIASQSGCTLTACTASGNESDEGIACGSDSTLTHCTASNNTQCRFGINAQFGSTAVNCTASANSSSEVFSAGIRIPSDGTLIGCTAIGNSNDNANPGPLTGIGISVGFNVVVRDCTVMGNKGDGIQCGEECLIIDNTCLKNGDGAAGDGAGIHLASTLPLPTGTRIEGNHVVGNDRGIEVDSTGNLVIRNSVSSNGTNFDIAAGNSVGPTVTSANIATSTNPHANYTP